MDDLELELEGAWIRIICRLWWCSERGKMTKSLKEFARILRKTEQKTLKILQILIEKGVASGSVLDNQNVTIINRRMVDYDRISQLRQKVGKLGGNPELLKSKKNLDNQNDNQKRPSSSSPSSSSSSLTTKKKNNTIFIKPSLEEVKQYCKERNRGIDPEAWYDKYLSNGWKVGKAGLPMKDWKATIRTWERSDFNKGGKQDPLPAYTPKFNENDDPWKEERAKYKRGEL